MCLNYAFIEVIKIAYKSKLPTLNEIGRILSYEGQVAFGIKAYNQTDGNCHGIASRIAEILGYTSISRQELTNKIHAVRSNWAWGTPLPEDIASPSPVNLAVRCPDNPNDVHVTLEAYGREYNYGPVTKEGFPIEMRIPLHKR